MPLLDEWEAHREEAAFPNYEAGSWGPDDSFRLLEQGGRRWRRP
jgi:glucose-6-phosphate 1-dehydrogenase